MTSQSVDFSKNYKVSVQDIVKSGQRGGAQDFGLNGYTFPTFDGKQDKPIVFSVSKDTKDRKFIQDHLNKLGKVPGPQYNVAGDMVIPKHKSSLPKANKITFSEKIIIESAKTPGVGKYNIMTKERILGNYSQ